MTTNLDIIPLIEKTIKEINFESVLDIGCGCFNTCGVEHDILSLFSDKQITGIDAFAKNIESRKSNGPQGNYIHAEVPDILSSIKQHDIVIAHHILEHLTFKQQKETLALIETQLARKLIIIGGPIGYHDNNGHVIATGNQFETHLDPLDPLDFEKRGYTISIVQPVFLATKFL